MIKFLNSKDVIDALFYIFYKEPPGLYKNYPTLAASRSSSYRRKPVVIVGISEIIQEHNTFTRIQFFY